MIADGGFIHPAAFFLILGLVLPFVPQPAAWRALILMPGALALWAVYSLVPGVFGHLHWVGFDLVLGRVDRLALVFAHVFAIQAVIGSLFSLHLKCRGQHVAAAFYVGGAFGCLFAGDYLTLFVFWEMMAVASTFLIWFNTANPRSLGAGYRYFLFHALGGMALFAGIITRYTAVGSMDFGAVLPATAAWYDYLILVGFAVNAAVVPLHAWLTDAYPEASITGAVFMSAFTTKTAVYVLARGFAGFEVLAVMGVVMTIYGVVYATIENNARRILAYHIVSQVGFMVAGIGIGTEMTINGACAHAYAHILYKGLLFMGVGCLLHAAGTARLTKLGGLAYRLPWVMLFYMVAAVSISGMPLFSGFVSKTMTIAGAAEAHRTWLAIGMEIASIGTFLSVGIKLPYFAFWSKEGYIDELRPIPWNMYLAMGLSAGLCLFIGLFPSALYALLPFPVHFEPYAPWNILQMSQLLAFTGLGFYLTRRIIAPKAGVNLDFDYVYRLVGRLVYQAFSRPLAFLDAGWSEVYRTVGLDGLLGMAGASNVLDKGGIDGVVDGTARTVLGVGRTAATSETGRLQDYLAGAVALSLIIFGLAWYLG